MFFDGEGAFPAVAVCGADLYAAAVEPVYALDGNVFVVAVFNENGISIVYFFCRIDEQLGSVGDACMNHGVPFGVYNEGASVGSIDKY